MRDRKAAEGHPGRQEREIIDKTGTTTATTGKTSRASIPAGREAGRPSGPPRNMQGQLREIDRYTKKSLILAQDER